MYYIKIAGECMLKMDLEYEKGILFIRLNGTLNAKNNYKINNYLVPVIKKHQIKNVIFNLKNLKSISESGIDAILNTKCTIKKNKGKIYLCEVNNNLVLKLKRLHIKMPQNEKIALKFCEV